VSTDVIFFLQGVGGKQHPPPFLSELMKTVGTKTNARLKNLFQRTIEELTLFLSYIVCQKNFDQCYHTPQHTHTHTHTHIHENGHVECESTLKHTYKLTRHISCNQ